MGIFSVFSKLWNFIYFIINIFFVYCNLFLRLFLPYPMKSLKSELVLVIGGAGGIGRSICIELSKQKAIVVSWDLNQHANDSLVKELRRNGKRAYGYVVDVSDRNTVAATANKLQEDLGYPSIIIHCAGIFPCHNFLSHNPKEITRCFEVNLFSQFWIHREFLPNMIERKRGHIVAISASHIQTGMENLTAYASTQGGIHCFMESIRSEINCLPNKPNIYVSTVYLGFCDTIQIRQVNLYSRKSGEKLLKIHSPEYTASKIIDGIRKNETMIFISNYDSLLWKFLMWQPARVKDLARKHLLPFLEPLNRS